MTRWCTRSAQTGAAPAGCTLFVFKGSAEGYELLSKTTIVQLPLAVSAQQTAGWKDLIVHAKGVGDVVLKATNQGYPLNPSMQPQATAADLEYSQQLLNYQQIAIRHNGITPPAPA